MQRALLVTRAATATLSSLAFREVVSKGFIRLEVGRGRSHCLCGEWMPSPSSLFMKARALSFKLLTPFLREDNGENRRVRGDQDLLFSPFLWLRTGMG